MAQISFFDGNTPFKIEKPIRLIELFGGYGSQHYALEYLGANFEQWKLCEWAIKSIQAYKDAHFGDDKTDYSKGLSQQEIIDYLANKGISQNYNEPMGYDQVKRLGEEKQRQIYNNIKATHNLVNICQVKGEDLEIKDIDKFTYVMTYSFPCQDLSSAGLGKGMEKDSGTRSGLLWEVERILDELHNGDGNLPQVLLMENVPEVIGSNNIQHFAKWLEKLESLGYHCYWEVLNAKDYGVPQNRERCFMVSILGDYYYEFPEPIKLEHKLKDLLEKNVDKSFYLSDNGIRYVLNRTPIGEKPNRANNIIGCDAERNAGTLTTTTTYRGEDNYIVTTLTQDGIDEKIYLKGKTNAKIELCNQLILNGQVEEGDMIRHSYTNARVNDFHIENKEYHDCSATLTTRTDTLGITIKELGDLRIRKLTPKECFRLMGVRDEDYEKIAKNQSNASLWHLSGDSIVVNVLMAIFREML